MDATVVIPAISLAGTSWWRLPRRFIPATVFAVAALLTVLPLLVQGCSCGHDFDFHLLSWMEAASQWQHGIAKPVWVFTAAFNAGEPRLLFYPPLSWTTGAFLGMVLPWTFVPVAFTWLVLFLCGLTMHRLLRRWVSPGVATLGGCLYLANPYMLFCAYERTAYGELMAAAWMPLLLAAMLRARVSLWRVALPVALLWLTNAPAAVVGSYSVLLLGVMRTIAGRRAGLTAAVRLAGAMTAGILLALLLDAFYLVPLAVERPFVQLAMAVIPIMTPEHNFLFMHDPDVYHTHVLLQASWIAIGTMSTALLCGAVLMVRRNHAQAMQASNSREADSTLHHTSPIPVATLTTFSMIVLFLLLPVSARVWRFAPELVFLQFPWRFLTVEAAVAIVLLCAAFQRPLSGVRPAILVTTGVALAALAGWFAGGTYFREACDDNETVEAQRDQFVHRTGVEPTDEYTPSDADNDVLRQHLPAAWLCDKADCDPGRTSLLVTADHTRPEDERFTTPLANQTMVIVRLRKFPGWHVLRDGAEIDLDTRDDGLMVVPITPGKTNHVEVMYRTTRDQWAGMAVSGITLLTVFAAGWRKRFGMMNHP